MVNAPASEMLLCMCALPRKEEKESAPAFNNDEAKRSCREGRTEAPRTRALLFHEEERFAKMNEAMVRFT